MEQLKLDQVKEVMQTHPFTVEELHLSAKGSPLDRPYYRLACPDWVNVLPVTREGKAVLIRQERVGSMTTVLETPGGVVDPQEKDPTQAVIRELEEETGYTCSRILSLGSINPNPAIMRNRCHYFVALDAHLAANRQHFPDEHEYLSVELVDTQNLEGLIRTGQINHSLSALCIFLAGRYVDIGGTKQG